VNEVAKNGIDMTKQAVIGALGSEGHKYFPKAIDGIGKFITVVPEGNYSETVRITIDPTIGSMAATLQGADMRQLVKEVAAAIASGGGVTWATDFLLGVVQRKLDLPEDGEDDTLNFRIGPLPVRRVAETDDLEDAGEGDAKGLEVQANIRGFMRFSSLGTPGNTDGSLGVWLSADKYSEKRETRISKRGHLETSTKIAEAEDIEKKRLEPDTPEAEEHLVYIDFDPVPDNEKSSKIPQELAQSRWYYFEIVVETEAPFDGDSINVSLELHFKSHAEHALLAFGTNMATIAVNHIELFLTPVHEPKKAAAKQDAKLEFRVVERQVGDLIRALQEFESVLDPSGAAGQVADANPAVAAPARRRNGAAAVAG
jgi:hypothetical protein